MSVNVLSFNTGLKKYVCDNGSVFSFNPKDLNLLAKLDTLQKNVEPLIDEIGAESREINKLMPEVAEGTEEGELTPEAQERVLALGYKTKEADDYVKEELRKTFGKQNDFDALFDGFNAFTVNDDGECIIAAFLSAITPIVEKDVNEAVNKLKKEKIAELKKNSKSKRSKK